MMLYTYHDNRSCGSLGTTVAVIVVLEGLLFVTATGGASVRVRVTVRNRACYGTSRRGVNNVDVEVQSSTAPLIRKTVTRNLLSLIIQGESESRERFCNDVSADYTLAQITNL